MFLIQVICERIQGFKGARDSSDLAFLFRDCRSAFNSLSTAGRSSKNHIFAQKYYRTWTLESWNPCTLASRPDLPAMIRTYSLY